MLEEYYIVKILSKPIQIQTGFRLKVFTFHNGEFSEENLWFKTEKEALKIKVGDKFRS